MKKLNQPKFQKGAKYNGVQENAQVVILYPMPPLTEDQLRRLRAGESLTPEEVEQRRLASIARGWMPEDAQPVTYETLPSTGCTASDTPS